MNKILVLAGVAATCTGGYAIACWLSRMTDWAERLDRQTDAPDDAGQDEHQRVTQVGPRNGLY
jgi:hypothetical protein